MNQLYYCYCEGVVLCLVGNGVCQCCVWLVVVSVSAVSLELVFALVSRLHAADISQHWTEDTEDLPHHSHVST